MQRGKILLKKTVKYTPLQITIIRSLYDQENGKNTEGLSMFSILSKICKGNILSREHIVK